MGNQTTRDQYATKGLCQRIGNKIHFGWSYRFGHIDLKKGTIEFYDTSQVDLSQGSLFVASVDELKRLVSMYKDDPHFETHIVNVFNQSIAFANNVEDAMMHGRYMASMGFHP